MKRLLGFLAFCGMAATANAQHDVAELERGLEEMLDGARLVGQFTVVGANGQTLPPQADQYAVSRLERTDDGLWVFHASMSYGAQQQALPVPVEIEWAGDTPMITLTEQTIPGLGTFTARVLLYDGLYAGTWKHGQLGGHMWGRIERAGSTAAPESTAPSTGTPDTAAPDTEAPDTAAPPAAEAPSDTGQHVPAAPSAPPPGER